MIIEKDNQIPLNKHLLKATASPDRNITSQFTFNPPPPPAVPPWRHSCLDFNGFRVPQAPQKIASRKIHRRFAKFTSPESYSISYILPDPSHRTHRSPFLGSPKAENLTHSEFSRIYPSFPFAFYLNPFCSTLSVPSEAEDAALGDCGAVWADSVKKKRNRKMNKHKYQKLRKRLRRQT